MDFISFTFYAIRKLHAHSIILRFFFSFLHFWVIVYLGGDSFSQRIGKIRRNFEDLKLEFEVENYQMDTQTVPHQPGVLLRGV